MQAKPKPGNKLFYLTSEPLIFGEVSIDEVGVSFKNGIPFYFFLDGRKGIIVSAINFKIAAARILYLYLKSKPRKRNKKKDFVKI